MSVSTINRSSVSDLPPIDPEPIISFKPRTINQNLDLAFRYLGQFLVGVLGMWLLIAFPTTALVYVFAEFGKIDLRWVVMIIYFATLPLGVLVINDAVPRIFGRSPFDRTKDPSVSRNGAFGLSVVLVLLGLGWAFLAENLGDRLGLTVTTRAWSIWGGIGLAGSVVIVKTLVSVARSQRIDWRTGQMFFLSLCLRSLCALGPALMLFPPFSDWRLAAVLILTTIPGIWMALRTGFLLEQTCFTRLDSALQGDHVRDALKEETGELFGRATWMAQFSFMVWAVLFVSADAVASLIFRTPLFLGRLNDLPAGSDLNEYLTHAWGLLFGDPLVLSTLTATALLVYVVNRLAWLFCYIDIRIRRDCWDLELKILQTTRRLSRNAIDIKN